MIDANNIIDMINHWLDTPPNGYFGQSYGADVRNLLLRELSADNADSLLRQLRRDVPITSQLSDSQLSISTQKKSHEAITVYLMVGGIAIDLGDSQTKLIDQDYYDVRAQ